LRRNQNTNKALKWTLDIDVKIFLSTAYNNKRPIKPIDEMILINPPVCKREKPSPKRKLFPKLSK